MTQVRFKYTVMLQLHLIPKTELHDSFPKISDVALESRVFDSYEECAESVKLLMEDFMSKANQNTAGETFSLSTEVNPDHTGIPVLSKDWEKLEISRTWLLNTRHVGKPSIQAAGRARILTVM